MLYRLPDLRVRAADRPVLVVEGEKDVENLCGLGLLATTNPMALGSGATNTPRPCVAVTFSSSPTTTSRAADTPKPSKDRLPASPRP